MKKFLSIVALLITSSCSNQENLVMPDVSIVQKDSTISANSEKVAYLGPDSNVVINKDLAVKRLISNEIKVGKYVDNQMYKISFSKGNNIGVVGHLAMVLNNSGSSTLIIEGNYYGNDDMQSMTVFLSFDDTKKILKSATNYKQNVDKLGKLFGN